MGLRFFAPGLAISIIAAGLMCADAGYADSVSGVRPVAAMDAQMTPGLAVKYFSRKFDRLRELRDWMNYKKGKAGPPLPSLDYADSNGTVLTSTRDDLVGAEITGAILLSEAGTYKFKVLSNDGVQVEIGGKRLLKDDRPHKTRFSNQGTVAAGEPGWYPIRVLYFEKKGSAALQLHWATPSGGGFAVVPAEAFGH